MIKKDIILRLILASIIFSILILSFYVYVTNIKNGDVKHKFDTSRVIPKIKENYDKAILKEYKTFENDVYLDKETNELIMLSYKKGIDYYIVGKYGKIYTNDIEIKEETIADDPTLITFETSEGLVGFKRPDNFEEFEYDYAYTLDYYNKKKELTYDYMVFDIDGNLTLLNTKSFVTTKIDENIKRIFYIPFDYYAHVTNPNNTTYYIIQDKYNKFGLMDEMLNIILEPEYELIYNSTTKDEYVAKKDGKYGLINSKNEVLLNFEYDDITYLNDYLLLRKDDKIGVFYNNKLIVDYIIPYYVNPKEDETLYKYSNEEDIYIVAAYPAEETSTTFWNHSKGYYINKKGLVRRIDSYIRPILDKNDNIEYFYSIRENNGNINVTFYDTDFFEYYTYSFKYEKAYDYYIDIEKIEESNNYKINIDYSKDSLDTTYYVDLFNSRETTEINSILKYFDNGYSFTLNDQGILRIYKNDKLLNEYKDIRAYFGDYYFYKDFTVYKLEFEKDS